MAMNKKEQAAMQALQNEVTRLKAWKLTEPVQRDLLPPHEYDKLSMGWDFNPYTEEVYKACSSSVHHGRGWEKTSSQQSLSMFSTRGLALRALRYEIEQRAITKLANVDRAISEAATDGDQP